MAEFINSIVGGFKLFTFRDAIDMFLVSILVYQLLILTRQTRAVQVLKGVGVFLFASWVAGNLKLEAMNWLMREAIRVGALAIVILFQPELRRALEQLGRGRILERSGLLTSQALNSERDSKEIADAICNMADRQVGALIIIERRTGLADIVATGTKIRAMLSSELLEQIFEPNTPLHDGAVIINAGLIVSAGCFLPLSENFSISRQLGTRHRAALGVSEISDCLAFVVSEETGIISLAQEGKLTRDLDEAQIINILSTSHIYPDESQPTFMQRIANWFNRRKKDQS